MKKEMIFASIFLAMILSVSVASALTKDEMFDKVSKIEDIPVIRELFAVSTGIWDFDDFSTLTSDANESFFVDNKFGAFVIFVVVWIILLLVLRDLIYSVSSFTSGVTWIVAVGLMLVIASLRGIFFVSFTLIQFLAWIASFAIWLEILVMVVLLFGSILGGSWAAKFALKRRMAREALNSRKGAEDVSSAITALKRIKDNL